MATYAGATRSRQAAANKSIKAQTGINRKKLFVTLAIGLLAVFVLVGLQAYTATLQHANNVLQEENAYIQAEIDSIDSQIVEETKVSKIEKTARSKYGMVYPTSDNCVTIHEDEDLADNLAMTIKKKAYN